MSSYLRSSPHTCSFCKKEFDIIFADAKIYKIKDMNPKFAGPYTCNDCGANEAILSLVSYIKDGRLKGCNFDNIKVLYKLLEDWLNNENS